MHSRYSLFPREKMHVISLGTARTVKIACSRKKSLPVDSLGAAWAHSQQEAQCSSLPSLLPPLSVKATLYSHARQLVTVCHDAEYHGLVQPCSGCPAGFDSCASCDVDVGDGVLPCLLHDKKYHKLPLPPCWCMRPGIKGKII